MAEQSAESVRAEMLANIANLDDDDLAKEVSFADGFGPEAASTASLWIELLHAEQSRRATHIDRSEANNG